MFAYTAPSYPTYSYPPLHPLSPFAAPRATPSPTARERYLQALVNAETARARYVSEIEAERFLASLRHKEALRQGEIRRRQVVAAQNALARRRLARIYAKNARPSLVFVPREGPQVVVREQEQGLPSGLQKTEESLIAELFGIQTNDEAQAVLEERQRFEKIRAEQARKVAVHDEVRFVTRIEAIREAVRASRAVRNNLHASQSSPACAVPSAKAPVTPKIPQVTKQSPIPETHLPEVLKHNNRQERAARAIQCRWRSHSADAAARKDALNTISILQNRFEFLRDTFSFPEHLEFRERENEQEHGVPTLLFTSANAAVHAYVHELTKLLTLADGVASLGSREIRDRRRTFVRLVEEALDRVDGRVAKVWGKRAVDVAAVQVAAKETKEAPIVVAEFRQVSQVLEAQSPEAPAVGEDYTDSDAASTIIPSRSKIELTAGKSPSSHDLESATGLPEEQDVESNDAPVDTEPSSYKVESASTLQAVDQNEVKIGVQENTEPIDFDASGDHIEEDDCTSTDKLPIRLTLENDVEVDVVNTSADRMGNEEQRQVVEGPAIDAAETDDLVLKSPESPTVSSQSPSLQLPLSIDEPAAEDHPLLSSTDVNVKLDAQRDSFDVVYPDFDVVYSESHSSTEVVNVETGLDSCAVQPDVFRKEADPVGGGTESKSDSGEDDFEVL